ncbi:GatB/YqeY domain-containing protein [Candidatus Pelagibacter sp.]|nr:GatB/YqeY domain-containing protein [Candidatus Pelagibacter sp.]
MSLKSKIEIDYQNSLKSKDKIEISTYRLILSGIKDLEILNRSSPNKKETNDKDIIQLIKKMIKQRNESIDIYKKNNRNDLLAVEEKEVATLSSYLPKQLTDDETMDICKQVINELGAQSIKDMGKIMGVLKKNYSDSLDFSKAGVILKEVLNKK